MRKYLALQGSGRGRASQTDGPRDLEGQSKNFSASLCFRSAGIRGVRHDRAAEEDEVPKQNVLRFFFQPYSKFIKREEEKGMTPRFRKR